MTDDRKPAQPPVPIPETVLAMVAGGQSLANMLQQGLITPDQYHWLSQHPSGAGRGG
jgi:hypothetical protein